MRSLGVMIGLVAGVLLVAAIDSGPSSAPVPTPTDRPPHTSIPPSLPPPFPPKKPSPVDTFRALLSRGPAERADSLAKYSEVQREYLREKLTRFDHLAPAERELWLRLLQVRYYLLPLLELDPRDRTEKLDQAPETDRRFLVQQLSLWDGFSPGRKRQALERKDSWAFLPFLAGAARATRPPLPPLAQSDRRRAIELELDRWRALAPDQRQRAAGRLLRFLQLSEKAQDRVLKAVSPAESVQLRKVLAGYRKMSVAERRRCILAFTQLSTMGSVERNEFWEKASRWQAMSREQRRAWRSFTTELPPFPPGAGGPPVPPLPPGGREARN